MRSDRNLLLLIVVAGISSASSASGQVLTPAHEPAWWRTAAGCYAAGDKRFLLDSVPYLAIHSIEEGSRLARSTDPYWQRGYDTYWRIIGADSVKLAWDGGLYGGSVLFKVHGDSLVGTERHFTDIAGVRDRPRRVVAVREPCSAETSYHPARPDSARAALLFGYGAALPTDAQLDADPWGAVAPLSAWLDAHPEVLTDFHFRVHARVMFQQAARIDVRNAHPELAGTYRLEIERTGGPTHRFYGRTEIRPQFALRAADTAAVVLDQPPGYRLRLTLSGDSTSLPRPGPGRRHRNPYGGNTAANSHLDVRLPAGTDADGTRRFRGYVMMVNFRRFFRTHDPALSEWEYEWFRRSHDHDGPNVFAEIVVSPDGRVTFTQRQELDPDRVITIRGERISGDAWQCVQEGC